MNPGSNIENFIEMEKKPENSEMKITDLNDYCLERIFDYLNLKDLVNVAVSKTIIQRVDGLVFQQRLNSL